jgi:aspartate dehydrogenase
MKLALIGCSAIGSAVLGLLRNDAAIESRRSWCAKPPMLRSWPAQDLAPGAAIVHSVPWPDVDLVVEAAGHAAIEQHVLPALAHGIDCIHALEAHGAFGSMELLMRNEPLSSNPKTSAQTVFSLVRAIRERLRAPPMAAAATSAGRARRR